MAKLIAVYIYKIRIHALCCRYIEVRPDEVCCPEVDRLSIGYGDSCCGTVPYSSSGAQMCCSGVLHSRYNQSCCGGVVTPSHLTCCGDEKSGFSFQTDGRKTCCGVDYVQEEKTLCCHGSNGQYKVGSILLGQLL